MDITVRQFQAIGLFNQLDIGQTEKGIGLIMAITGKTVEQVLSLTSEELDRFILFGTELINYTPEPPPGSIEVKGVRFNVNTNPYELIRKIGEREAYALFQGDLINNLHRVLSVVCTPADGISMDTYSIEAYMLNADYRSSLDIATAIKERFIDTVHEFNGYFSETDSNIPPLDFQLN